VALPHSKSDVISDVLGLVGHSAEGIPWPGALDGEPVRFICIYALTARG
jgi:hypothetical protein